MGQFGQELRREREGRGVSVDAICAATKVSLRHLRALEENRFEELPGGVFRKGIVRSYLAALALDEAVWMPRYELTLRERGVAGTADADWTEFAQNVQRNRRHDGPPTGMRWFGVVLMLLALLVCTWLAWRFVLHDRMGTVNLHIPPLRTAKSFAASPGDR